MNCRSRSRRVAFRWRSTSASPGQSVSVGCRRRKPHRPPSDPGRGFSQGSVRFGQLRHFSTLSPWRWTRSADGPRRFTGSVALLRSTCCRPTRRHRPCGCGMVSAADLHRRGEAGHADLLEPGLVGSRALEAAAHVSSGDHLLAGQLLRRARLPLDDEHRVVDATLIIEVLADLLLRSRALALVDDVLGGCPGCQEVPGPRR